MNRSLSRRRDDQDDEPPRGASRIVYVGDRAFETDAITVITPRQLDELLAQGFTVRQQRQRKVTGPQGRPVAVEQVVLDQVRAVARRREPRGLSALEESERALVSGGAQPASNGSYLGDRSDFANVPGIQLHNAKLHENSYAMGVDAAMSQGPGVPNPFPRGCKPFEQWERGYQAGLAQSGAQLDPAAAKEAFQLGKQAAKGPEDVEVECPYPAGTALYRKWLAGFEAGGGKVEAEEGGSGAAVDDGMV